MHIIYGLRRPSEALPKCQRPCAALCSPDSPSAVATCGPSSSFQPFYISTLVFQSSHHVLQPEMWAQLSQDPLLPAPHLISSHKSTLSTVPLTSPEWFPENLWLNQSSLLTALHPSKCSPLLSFAVPQGQNHFPQAFPPSCSDPP